MTNDLVAAIDAELEDRRRLTGREEVEMRRQRALLEAQLQIATAVQADLDILRGHTTFTLPSRRPVFHLYSVRGHGTPDAQEVPMAAAYSMDLRTRVLKDSGRRPVVEGARRAVSRESGVGRCAEAAAARNGFDRPHKQTKFRGRVLAGQEDAAGRAGRRPARCDARGIARGAADVGGLATVWRDWTGSQFTVKKNDSRRRTTPARRRR